MSLSIHNLKLNKKTPKEKLIALGFEKKEFVWIKEFFIDKNRLLFVFYPNINQGNIMNRTIDAKPVYLNNFTELLKWNDFYEKKQFRRSESRNTSRNDSETQNDVQRA